MKKTTILVSLLSLLIFSTGCEQQEDPLSTTTEQPSNDAPSQAEEEAKAQISSSSSSINGLSILGSGPKRILSFNAATAIIEIAIPFPLLSNIDISGTLPDHPEISFHTDSSERSLVISVPLDKYLDLTKSPTTLPSGRPLPGISGGEPPSLGFPISNSKGAYGYFAVDYVAFFVESSLKLPLSLKTNITSDQDGSILGTLSWLPKQGEHPAGVFISLRLPRSLAVYLANAQ